MMDKNRPIGVFDSGVGGLSVLRTLEKKLPGENYIYFGDTARVPYGNRSPEEVRAFTTEIGLWLAEAGCKMLLIACNTATVLGMEALKAVADIPVFGMVEAALQGALSCREAGEPWPIGLIATKGTVESGGYQAAFAANAPGKPFYAQACPDFVDLVEKGILEGPAAERAIEQYLRPLKEKHIRTLVLGCTHFPFLAPAIAAYLGPAVRLTDPSLQLALTVEAFLKEKGLLNEGAAAPAAPAPAANVTFYCSGGKEAFMTCGSVLLGRRINEVKARVF